MRWRQIFAPDGANINDRREFVSLRAAPASRSKRYKSIDRSDLS